RLTARWLRDHPIAAGDLREGSIPGSGSFNYDREDAILAAWRRAEEMMTAVMAEPALTGRE
ncbi:MAG: hypothetical protein AB7U18_21240, partial [Dehalococcoidia bacterium]